MKLTPSLGLTLLLDEATQCLSSGFKSCGIRWLETQDKSHLCQKVQSWHCRGHCILVPAAEAALWLPCHLEWVLGFANSAPCNLGVGFSQVFRLQLSPQIHVCIQIWPCQMARGGEGRLVTAVVSFCGSVAFPSCPQGMGDSRIGEGVCEIKSSAGKARNAMETQLGMLFEYSLLNHHN